MSRRIIAFIISILMLVLSMPLDIIAQNEDFLSSNEVEVDFGEAENPKGTIFLKSEESFTIERDYNQSIIVGLSIDRRGEYKFKVNNPNDDLYVGFGTETDDTIMSLGESHYIDLRANAQNAQSVKYELFVEAWKDNNLVEKTKVIINVNNNPIDLDVKYRINDKGQVVLDIDNKGSKITDLTLKLSDDTAKYFSAQKTLDNYNIESNDRVSAIIVPNFDKLLEIPEKNYQLQIVLTGGAQRKEIDIEYDFSNGEISKKTVGEIINEQNQEEPGDEDSNESTNRKFGKYDFPDGELSFADINEWPEEISIEVDQLRILDNNEYLNGYKVTTFDVEMNQQSEKEDFLSNSDEFKIIDINLPVQKLIFEIEDIEGNKYQRILRVKKPSKEVKVSDDVVVLNEEELAEISNIISRNESYISEEGKLILKVFEGNSIYNKIEDGAIETRQILNLKDYKADISIAESFLIIESISEKSADEDNKLSYTLTLSRANLNDILNIDDDTLLSAKITNGSDLTPKYTYDVENGIKILNNFNIRERLIDPFDFEEEGKLSISPIKIDLGNAVELKFDISAFYNMKFSTEGDKFEFELLGKKYYYVSFDDFIFDLGISGLIELTVNGSKINFKEEDINTKLKNLVGKINPDVFEKKLKSDQAKKEKFFSGLDYDDRYILAGMGYQIAGPVLEWNTPGKKVMPLVLWVFLYADLKGELKFSFEFGRVYSYSYEKIIMGAKTSGTDKSFLGLPDNATPNKEWNIGVTTIESYFTLCPEKPIREGYGYQKIEAGVEATLEFGAGFGVMTFGEMVADLTTGLSNHFEGKLSYCNVDPGYVENARGRLLSINETCEHDEQICRDWKLESLLLLRARAELGFKLLNIDAKIEGKSEIKYELFKKEGSSCPEGKEDNPVALDPKKGKEYLRKGILTKDKEENKKEKNKIPSPKNKNRPKKRKPNPNDPKYNVQFLFKNINNDAKELPMELIEKLRENYIDTEYTRIALPRINSFKVYGGFWKFKKWTTVISGEEKDVEEFNKALKLVDGMKIIGYWEFIEGEDIDKDNMPSYKVNSQGSQCINARRRVWDWTIPLFESLKSTENKNFISRSSTDIASDFMALGVNAQDYSDHVEGYENNIQTIDLFNHATDDANEENVKEDVAGYLVSKISLGVNHKNKFEEFSYIINGKEIGSDSFDIGGYQIYPIKAGILKPGKNNMVQKNTHTNPGSVRMQSNSTLVVPLSMNEEIYTYNGNPVIDITAPYVDFAVDTDSAKFKNAYPGLIDSVHTVDVNVLNIGTKTDFANIVLIEIDEEGERINLDVRREKISALDKIVVEFKFLRKPGKSYSVEVYNDDGSFDHNSENNYSELKIKEFDKSMIIPDVKLTNGNKNIDGKYTIGVYAKSKAGAKIKTLIAYNDEIEVAKRDLDYVSYNDEYVLTEKDNDLDFNRIVAIDEYGTKGESKFKRKDVVLKLPKDMVGKKTSGIFNYDWIHENCIGNEIKTIISEVEEVHGILSYENRFIGIQSKEEMIDMTDANFVEFKFNKDSSVKIERISASLKQGGYGYVIEIEEVNQNNIYFTPGKYELDILYSKNGIQYTKNIYVDTNSIEDIALDISTTDSTFIKVEVPNGIDYYSYINGISIPKEGIKLGDVTNRNRVQVTIHDNSRNYIYYYENIKPLKDNIIKIKPAVFQLEEDYNIEKYFVVIKGKEISNNDIKINKLNGNFALVTDVITGEKTYAKVNYSNYGNGQIAINRYDYKGNPIVGKKKVRLIFNGEYNYDEEIGNYGYFYEQSPDYLNKGFIPTVSKKEEVKQIKKEEKKEEPKVEATSEFTTLYFYLDKGYYETLIDGTAHQIPMDVQPTAINQRTMLPIRFVAEAIGATVEWHQDTKSATFTKDGITATITLGNPVITVSDGRTIQMDAEPIVISERIMVPLTNISQIFGMTNGDLKDGVDNDIEWDQENYRVIIKIKK